MKRYFISGLISMMLILVMSGCQKKVTPESLLQQVKKNVEGSTGIDVSMSMELRAEADEADEASYDEDLTMRYDVKASHEPEIFYIDEQLTGHVGGETLEDTHIYLYGLLEEPEGTIWYGDGEDWSVKTGSEKEITSVTDLIDLPGKLASGDDMELTIQKEEENQEFYVLSGTVTGAMLERMANAVDSVGEIFGGAMFVGTGLYDFKVPITIRIDRETKQFASITLDMTEAINTWEEESDFSYVGIRFDFHAFQLEEPLAVPDEVKENAFDEEAYVEEDPSEDSEPVELTPGEDELTQTEDRTMGLKETTVEAPAEMNEWASTYTLLTDGTYHEVSVQVTGVIRGKEAAEQAKAYFEKGPQTMFDYELPETLEYGFVTYEVYIPDDFPEDTYLGMEMYLTAPDGEYLNNDAYSFTDQFWIEQTDPDALAVGPGQTAKGVGLFTIEKDRTEYMIQIGDSWYHEAYIRIQ